MKRSLNYYKLGYEECRINFKQKFSKLAVNWGSLVDGYDSPYDYPLFISVGASLT